MSELHEHYRHSIEAANTRFAALVEHSFDVMAITTSEGLITYISPACTTMFGLRPDELTGAHLADRVHPDDVRRVRRWWRRLAAGELDVASFTCRMWHTQLGWRHIEQTVTSYLSDSHVGGLVANARDVTDQVDTHARLEHQTLHDALTGLPNRAFFLDRLERTIAGDTQDAESAVLVIDLDLFKQINDTFGYAVGDRVLITTAERIRAVLRTTDNVARLESDEFAVLADCVDGRTGATKIADRIAAAVSAPITIDGQSVSVGCSIGLAIPRAGDQPEAVLNAADLTMHQAKERGAIASRSTTKLCTRGPGSAWKSNRHSAGRYATTASTLFTSRSSTWIPDSCRGSKRWCGSATTPATRSHPNRSSRSLKTVG
ncbi:sensor domain-containing diguanylate cyclase [Mycolicibacterium llatzerense]|uniref:sensor domain-containing diguanylate cyclase n=1 Tax=Mycolicibacterium llatzerense TaxID=280871 RepID=UPI0013A6C926|nr:sensor domain-containing diguanylate cyclase [Mycolicibacterium llatzerense]